ncbi:MAG: DUF5343 domain-containing protein [Ignavibacteriaceae bacterium]
MAKEQKDNYPNLPSKLWWQLREKFKTSIPSTITPGYVATALDMKESSAKANVMPALIKLGFVDDKFKPKDRVYEWRDDKSYSKVCEEIIKEIYPEELIEALPGPNPPRVSVERWFANKAKVGANAAKKMAITYEILCEADFKKGEESISNAKSINDKPKSKIKDKIERSTTKRTDNGKTVKGEDEDINKDFNPSVHIDIQIHISPDASPEQIDKIFISMSKHIFKKKLADDEN